MIHPSAIVGSPPEHRDFPQGGYYHRPEIHPDARINAFVTVDGGLNGPTHIGARTFTMAHCHIGHDAWVGNDCELAPGTVIGGHAVLEDGVRCGIGVLIRPFVRVGAGARLGAGAVVVKDVPAGETWVGNPARKFEKKRPGRVVILGPDEAAEWWAARAAEVVA
jgi:acyl-[acyl carrier protein]--UDP-N-acetylglucosamine O-acyltransferase